MSTSDSGPVIVVESGEQPDIGSFRDSIIEMLQQGLTIQVIAARLNLDPTHVLGVSDEAQTDQQATLDNKQKLKAYLAQVDEIIDLAHWQCKADPTPNNIYAYTALVEAARGIVQDVDARRDNEKLVDDILLFVIGPMFSDILSTVSNKLSAARDNINKLLSPDKQSLAQGQLEDILRELAVRQKEQLGALRASILRVLNDVQEQKPASKALVKRSRR